MNSFAPAVSAICFLAALGCASKSDKDAGPRADIARLPSAELELEAAVESLTLTTDLEQFVGGSEFPVDTGRIRILEVASAENPDEIDLSDYQAGKTVGVTFLYGARRAVVRWIPVASAVQGDAVSCSVERTFTLEGETSIYSMNDCNLSELRSAELRGLEIGGQLRAALTVCPECLEPVSIGVYE